MNLNQGGPQPLLGPESFVAPLVYFTAAPKNLKKKTPKPAEYIRPSKYCTYVIISGRLGFCRKPNMLLPVQKASVLGLKTAFPSSQRQADFC